MLKFRDEKFIFKFYDAQNCSIHSDVIFVVFKSFSSDQIDTFMYWNFFLWHLLKMTQFFVMNFADQLFNLFNFDFWCAYFGTDAGPLRAYETTVENV